MSEVISINEIDLEPIPGKKYSNIEIEQFIVKPAIFELFQIISTYCTPSNLFLLYVSYLTYFIYLTSIQFLLPYLIFYHFISSHLLQYYV